VRLDGPNSADRRGALLETFRTDPETPIALMSAETCSVGLNMTNANHVLLLEPFTTGAAEAQAACRVHRIGQTRPVEVLKFYTKGTIDERLLLLRERRGELEDASAATGSGGDSSGAAGGEEGAAGGTTEFSDGDRRILFGAYSA